MRLAPLATLLLAACGGGSQENPTSPRDEARGAVRRDARTVVVVVIDGLGRNHLASYGAARDVTPNLTALADDAAVFEDPIAVTTGVNAGLATLLTGQRPARHGVGSLRHRGQHRLADGRRTLAESLRDAGWRTFAALSLPQLEAELSGLDQGFETYLAPGLHEGDRRDAEATWYNALPGFRAVFEEDMPVLALLHLADPGAPDGASGADGVRFLEAHLGRFRAERPLLALALDRAPGDPEGALRDIAKLVGRGRGSNVHLAWRAALYDSRLAVVDRVLGQLRDLLRQTGREHDALIVVTATRGALLTPPARSGAPAFPAPMIEVPLVVRFPGATPSGRVSGVTSVLDLAPTLAELCDVTLDADGATLLPRLEAEQATGTARVVSPGLETVALVNDALVVEENRVAGLVGWRRDGTRVLRKSATGPEVAAFEAAEQRLGALGRADELSWLTVESGGDLNLRVAWRANAGFVGLTLLEQDEVQSLTPRGLAGSARFARAPGVLRTRLGEREAALRVDLDLGGPPIDEERIWVGARPLAESHLPRLRDKGGTPWPDERTPSAVFEERGSGWWILRVGDGLPAGRPVQALVVAYPPTPSAAPLDYDCGPEVRVARVPGRDDALWLRGETPLEVSFERTAGVQEFALSVHVDGQALLGDAVRYGGRAMAEPGQISLYLPDWIDEVTDDLSTGAGAALAPGHVRIRRDGPALAPEERTPATREQREFARKLGGRE